MKQRDHLAAMLRNEGKTFKDVGLVLGVGTERARAIVVRAQRSLESRVPHWTDGLKKRIANNLMLDYNSKKQLQRAIASGRFLPRSDIGPKNYALIKLWLRKA